MSEQALGSIATERAGEGRPAWRAWLTRAGEFCLLFGAAMLIEHGLQSSAGAPQPNPLWLPVIVLALQHGLTVGITAALTASALYLSNGVPDAALAEDFYAHVARIAAEPVGWSFAALLIGHLRSRHIAHTAELAAELAERRQHCSAIADLCTGLQQRADRLERQIATSGKTTDLEIAEAMAALKGADSANAAECLARFIVLMTGTVAFSVYRLRGGNLDLAMERPQRHHKTCDTILKAGDPLFAAIVHERRTVSVTRPADRKRFSGGVLAGPLIELGGSGGARGVIGMLAIGGDEAVEFDGDIERRFALACSEVARLFGRKIVLEGEHDSAGGLSTAQEDVATQMMNDFEALAG